MAVKYFLKRHRRKFIIILTPLLLLPLPLVVKTQEAKCAYGLLLMAVYWITEALPISVTSVLPIIIFPMMGVSKVSDLAQKYTTGVHFVFMGGMAMAISIQKWNLHRRFAIKLLLLFGTTIKWLTFGFMVTTAFLSMWVSNTATTAMMIPIGQAVLNELVKVKKGSSSVKDVDEHNGMHICSRRSIDDYLDVVIEVDHVEDIQSGINDQELQGGGGTTAKLVEPKCENDNSFVFSELDRDNQNTCKLICLCICYAANCGGIATLTGTDPNFILKGQLDILSDGQSGITFATWFIFGFPIAIVSTFLNWIILQISFYGWRKSEVGRSRRSIKSLFRRPSDEDPEQIKSILRNQYEFLGDISFAEKAVCFFFVLLVLLWFSCEPGFVPGWGYFFQQGYVSDAVPGIIVMIILFIFPSTLSISSGKREIPPLLDWQTFQEKMPWGVMLLMGGGFALATACQESNLSQWLGLQLSILEGIPVWIMILIVCTLVSLATEITSNAATTTIILPVLSEMAVGMRKHPTLLMLPATVAASFAFMLPVATPPNTLAFSYGYLKVKDMVKTGVFLNISCVFLVTIAINTYGVALFNLDHYPDWPLLHKASNLSTVTQNLTLLS